MPFIKPKCPQCGKPIEIKSTIVVNEARINLLACGHLLTNFNLEARDFTMVRSLDGKALLPFQVETAKFLEEGEGRGIITHEPGLGKTVCLLGFLAIHTEKMPILIVVKATLKAQWQREILRWTDNIAQIVEDARTPLIPGLQAYIITYDLLRRFPEGKLAEQVKRCNIQTLALDECQQIKNATSQRTNSVRELAEQIKSVVGLSGTPIRNHAGEYFPILNLVAPERYHNRNQYISNECDSSASGYGWKVGGLADPERFLNKNSDIIFRKTRAEVLPELPTIDRRFQYSDLGKEVERAYLDTFKEFQNEMNSATQLAGFERSAQILKYLTKMRHISGLSKIGPCADFIEEFLEGTDRKIVIFVHHKDVMSLLTERIAKICVDQGLDPPLNLKAGDPSSPIVQELTSNCKRRVLIASTLAAGEGVDGLQSLSDMILLERQWNPANEEQVEGRFIRIGGQTEFKSVSATYWVAVGTVDEFFAEIVEQKREIVSSALDGKAMKWNETSIIRDLADLMNLKGGKKWGL